MMAKIIKPTITMYVGVNAEKVYHVIPRKIRRITHPPHFQRKHNGRRNSVILCTKIIGLLISGNLSG
jgi:hypothetical protein